MKAHEIILKICIEIIFVMSSIHNTSINNFSLGVTMF